MDVFPKFHGRRVLWLLSQTGRMVLNGHFHFLATLLCLNIEVFFRGFDLDCWGVWYGFCYDLELLLLTNFQTVLKIGRSYVSRASNWRFQDTGIMIRCKNQVCRVVRVRLKSRLDELSVGHLLRVFGCRLAIFF